MGDQLTEQIIAAAIDVHRLPCPRLLESICEEVAIIELQSLSRFPAHSILATSAVRQFAYRSLSIHDTTHLLIALRATMYIHDFNPATRTSPQIRLAKRIDISA